MKTSFPSLTRLAGALALGGWLCASAQAGGLPDCPVSPFGDASAEQHATLFDGRCNFDSTRWKLETPKARPVDAGPSVVRAQYSSLTSVRYTSELQGSIKFDYAGQRGEDALGGLRFDRTAVALGGLYQIDDSLALQTNLGLEHVGVPRARATVTSSWRPIKTGVLFAEWANGLEPGTEARRVGGRLWLVPRKLAIDLGARYVPDGPGWVDHRIGLAFALEM